MKINKLIDLCRYYKGEDNNPFEGKDQNKAMFWFYEKYWVEQTLKIEKEGENSHAVKYIGEMISDYQNAGLWNFEVFDHVPLALKALLFNRYNHWNIGGTDGFKEFYLKEYIGEK